LIDVFTAELDGSRAISEKMDELKEMVGLEDWPRVIVKQEKIHREIYENLREFDGF